MLTGAYGIVGYETYGNLADTDGYIVSNCDCGYMFYIGIFFFSEVDVGESIKDGVIAWLVVRKC